jgi:type I restriction enzyme M protein
VLDTTTKRRIDTARDILVGKVPDPKSQVDSPQAALQVDNCKAAAKYSDT